MQSITKGFSSLGTSVSNAVRGTPEERKKAREHKEWQKEYAAKLEALRAVDREKEREEREARDIEKQAYAIKRQERDAAIDAELRGLSPAQITALSDYDKKRLGLTMNVLNMSDSGYMPRASARTRTRARSRSRSRGRSRSRSISRSRGRSRSRSRSRTGGKK